jgi:hypothetical protein
MFTTNFQLLLINANSHKSIYANLNLIKKECYKKYSDTKRENVEMKVEKDQRLRGDWFTSVY